MACTVDNRHRWILGAASLVLGLVVLDETVVGVALPTIRAELAMTEVNSHWVVNAYLLTFTCFVAIGGKLGDLLGRRRVFVAGAALFCLGSAVAGAAPSGGWLIAARALQGVGAAMTFPASMAIITATFPPARRGAAFGVQTTIAACFMASGPVVGGLFAELISWRWIFWINVPIIAVTVAVLFAMLEPHAGSASPGDGAFGPARFDYPGLALLVAGLTGVTVGLMQSADWGWTSPAIVGSLVVGAVLLALFVVLELRRATPVVELALLRIRTFAGGNVVFALFQFEKMVVFIFVALYLQQVQGRSPIEAGLVVSVAIVPTLITSRWAGAIRDKYGSRMPATVALVLTAAALSAIGLGTAQGNEALIAAVLIGWGAVMPFIAVSTRPALMGAVPAAKQGEASGINLSVQMLGGTIGIALGSVLVVHTGSFWLLFQLTAVLILVVAVVAWLAIDRLAGRPVMRSAR